MSVNPEPEVSLTPIGTVDTTSATTGAFLLNCFVNSTFLSNGNLLQFEYIVAPYDSSDPDKFYTPDEITQGFIAIENAGNAGNQGISNQFTISVPSIGYDTTASLAVKVRVYKGETSTGSNPAIIASEWSEQVIVYNPPIKPVITNAYLVRGDVEPYYSTQDYLYVQLEVPSENGYGDDIDFVVSYYYKDQNNDTKWVVVNVDEWDVYTLGTTQIIGLNPIPLPDDLDVSWTGVLYVAVNAVYPYQIGSLYYYAVSEISETELATEADYSPAVLNPIVIPTDYLVYTTGAQTINLSWTQAASTIIPNFAVSSYEIIVNDGTTTTTIGTVGSDVLSYTVDISSYAECGTTLTFSINTVFETGGEMISNTESVNIFKKSDAPMALIVNWATPGDIDGTVDFRITLVPPEDTGCGTPVKFVLTLNDTVLTSDEVTYDPAKTAYIISLNDMSASSSGTISCVLYTRDTNETTSTGEYELIAGASISASYQSSELPIIIDIVRSDEELTFLVVSQTQLDKVARIIYVQVVDQVFATLAYNTDSPVETYDYTVEGGTTPDPDTGDYVYEMTFFPSFFPGNSIPAHFVLAASNDGGIGTQQYPPLPSP
jgi:hypothetical protein